MKVFVEPVGMFSKAMVRISNALKRYAPSHVQFVDNEEQADLVVMYVIGFDYMDRANRLLAASKDYVALQCCLKSTENTVESEWYDFWRNAALVWSYYDLREHAAYAGFDFCYSPLGVDDVFVQAGEKLDPSSDAPFSQRENLVLTSGYVHGSSAEAIEEVWVAARRLGLRTIHIGPRDVEGTLMHADEHITPNDEQLADLYCRARHVSALRHKEGFELFGAEAMACCVRPLAFPHLSSWYQHFALYVPDCCGESLVKALVGKMQRSSDLSYWARGQMVERFSWERICTEFWRQLGAGKKGKQAGTKEIAYAG